jgi:hypothetical protein
MEGLGAAMLAKSHVPETPLECMWHGGDRALPPTTGLDKKVKPVVETSLSLVPSQYIEGMTFLE